MKILPRLILAFAVVLPSGAALAETREEAISLMSKVADWQLANPSRHAKTDWTQAPFYVGALALAKVSGSTRFLDAMLEYGAGNGWKLGRREYHADDHAVGQAYAEMYLLKRDPKMIEDLQARFDHILAEPRDGSLTFDRATNPGYLDRWSWCDALFMAPPAWARLAQATGNEAYLTFAVDRWWVTSAHLYDKDEHLFYRDDSYFQKREANGKKIFWSRGNGWVMGGLVRMLQSMPPSHPLHGKFVRQFQEMAERVRPLQQADGLWRSSLLDPEHYPMKETSGSGFFVYALAWGVNEGLLDSAKFKPAALKGWAGLEQCVTAEGKLTHVQPVGADPKKFSDDATEVYGVGAFLLAGSEIIKLL